MAHLLLAQGINKHFGAVVALKSARFALNPGEVHALMGENGAGKSTLARIIAGAERADSGEIVIDGRRVSIADPLEAQRLGISIIYQELDLFPHLTVGENIVIGNLHFTEGRIVSVKSIEEFCRPFLEQAGLTCGARALVASLSIGQQQLLAIARALSMNARILVMDEPTSALSEDAAERLFTLIASLKLRGLAIIYVSHKMEEIFRLCDRVTVLRDGEMIGTRSVGTTDSDELIRMMVGRSVDLSARPQRRKTDNVLLSVTGLTTRKLEDISFELHEGEVLGIAGLVGAGRSALGAVLFGLDRLCSGRLSIKGQPFKPKTISDSRRHGLGLLPEDRKRQGLMMQMSVLENGTLSVLPRLGKFGFLKRRSEVASMTSMSKRVGLKCASVDRAVGTLSGGNQQKALLVRMLLADPEILFLDDPTRGIDIGAKDDIHQVIDELAQSGKGIILVSSELPELLRCCDRILVLSQGRVAGIFSSHEATSERIMAAATKAVDALQRAS